MFRADVLGNFCDRSLTNVKSATGLQLLGMDEMKSDQVIRRATSNDLGAIYHCLGQMVTFLPDPSDWSEIGRRFFEQESVCAFVAERRAELNRQQVIGYASVCFETKIRGGTIGHVEDVVVDSKFRRGGLGLMLVRAMQSEARMRGAYRLYLECSDENTRFYSAAGFNRSGVSMSWEVK